MRQGGWNNNGNASVALPKGRGGLAQQTPAVDGVSLLRRLFRPSSTLSIAFHGRSL